MEKVKYNLENVKEAIKVANQLYGLNKEEIEQFCTKCLEAENSSIDFALTAYVSSVLFDGGNRELEDFLADKNVPNSFKYGYIKNIKGKVSDKKFEKSLEKIADTLNPKVDTCSYFNFVNDFIMPEKKIKNPTKYIVPLMELEKERHKLLDWTFSYESTGVMKDYIQPTKNAPFNHIGIRADNLIKHYPLSEQLIKKAVGNKQNKEVIKYMRTLANDMDVQAVNNIVESCQKQDQM